MQEGVARGKRKQGTVVKDTWVVGQAGKPYNAI